MNLFISIILISIVTSLATTHVNAFPIFAPSSAYINCQSSPGFLGDNTSVNFASGTFANTEWSAGESAVVLSAAQTTGTFTSRVIDNSCISVGKPWLGFSWTTSLPFGKELPSSSESSANYSALGANLMTNLEGLWRYNKTTAYTNDPDGVVDSSGLGRHGNGDFYNSVTTPAQVTTGLLNNGILNTNPGAGIRVTAARLPSYNVFTASFWFKGTAINNFQQIIKRGKGNFPTGWALTVDPAGTFYFESDTSAGGGYVNPGVAIFDGNWKHIVTVANNGALSIFINGTKYTGAYPAGAGFTDSVPLDFLAGVAGSMDENALWSRALSDAEVATLYRRGINRVKFQVRNCTSSTCADNPTWQGPDGTATTWFTELNNNSVPLTGLGNVLTGAPNMLWSVFTSITKINRYMQYKFTLETDNTTYSPNVKTAGPGR